MISRYYKIMVLLVAIVTISCKKDFLDKKPNSNLAIPATLDDFQKMLDTEVNLGSTTSFGEISADDYQFTDANYASMTENSKKAAIWSNELFGDITNVSDWDLSYQQVFYANVVLEGLKGIAITSLNQKQWNTIKGSALFIRAYAFYNLSQVFSPMYDENAADNPYGIPLRLTSGIDDPTKRSTVKQTYDQITNDLKEADDLLPPDRPALNLNRPYKVAAKALLARVYLSMKAYLQAGQYASEALSRYNKLIDYNTVSTTAATPFTILNDEVIYQSEMEEPTINSLRLVPGYAVKTEIIQSYYTNDLRRSIFFNAAGNVKRGYSGNPRFNGLATDELYIINAECKARGGNIAGAMKDLNDLLRMRYIKINNVTSYVDQTAANQADALAKVLMERRKELPIRGLRWSDLRRLNKEGYNISLSRTVNGVTYTLPPNDLRYVLPIPQNVINLTGIAQNPR